MPLVYSVNGMACNEARASEKRIASLLSDKWNRTYNKLVGYVRGRIGHEHPPLKHRLTEGGPREEAGGTVGGRRRRLRGVGGVDGGLSARLRQHEYRRLHGITGSFARESDRGLSYRREQT